MNKTKKSLLASGLSLLICTALLVGTTFAWFTDSVTNKGNTIQAGQLDVGFQYRALNSTGTYQGVPTEASQMGKLFADQLWEPNYANGLDLKVINNGTVALKWQLYFTNVVNTDATDDGIESQIADVLDVYVIGAEEDETALTDDCKIGTLSSLADGGFVTGGTLNTAGEAKEWSVVLKMQQSAGNTYQGCSVTFDVELRATQAAYESDGFGNTQYDAAADGSPDYNWNTVISGYTESAKPATGWEQTTLLALDGLSVSVPAGAIDPDADTISLKATPTTTASEISIDATTQQAIAYDITVTGLVDGNAIELPVRIYIGKNLTEVQVYHHAALIAADYDADTGYVDFLVTSFSPFTFVYKDGTTYVSTESQLQAALNAGGNIQLQTSLDLSQRLTVAEGTSAVLDLNGKTLRMPDGETNYDLILNEGTLTIKNGSLINEISNNINATTPGNNAAVRCTKGSITLEDCTISNKSGISFGNYCVTISEEGSAQITRCNIIADRGGLAVEDNAAAQVADCTITAAYYYPLYVYGNGDTTIENTTFIKTPKMDYQAGAGGNALIYNGIDPEYNDQGTVTLSNCTFKSTREEGSQLEIFNYFYQFTFSNCVYDNVVTNFSS